MALPSMHKQRRGMALSGLMDIIFLLLIFSLVTITVSRGVTEESGGNRKDVMPLPRTSLNQTDRLSDVVESLVFLVDYADPENPAGARIVTILQPSGKDSLTYASARQRAYEDSAFAVIGSDSLFLDEKDFRRTRVNRLIRSSLDAYKREHFTAPAPDNVVEIRAVRETEFRIIRTILDACNAYGDTIPSVVMHTLAGEESTRGL